MNEITNHQQTIVQGQPLDAWTTSGMQTAFGRQEDSGYRPQPVPKKSKLGCIATLLFVTIVVAVMIFTCPATPAHKEALTDIVTSSVTKVANENLPANGLIATGVRMFSNMLMKKVVDTAVDNLVTVDNYIVCSVGKVNYDGEDHIVSVGVFGHIFTTDQTHVEEAARKYYLGIQQQLEESFKQGINDNIVNPLLDSFNGFLESL